MTIFRISVMTVLLAFPFFVFAVSSTSYEIDPEPTTSSSYHSSTSSSFSLDGVFESIGESNSSTSYTIESGGSLQWYCGDGFVDPGEACDFDQSGTYIGTSTCITQGFESGTISCSSSCTLVTTACNSAAAVSVPAPVSSTPVGVDNDEIVIYTDEETGEEVIDYPMPASSSSVFAPSVASLFTDGTFFTYQPRILLYGTLANSATELSVDGTSATPEFVSDRIWNLQASLSFGQNIIELISTQPDGSTYTTYISVVRRLMADTNDDGAVDDLDLSRVATSWATFNRTTDFNQDGSVDDYDLSILSANWTSN